MHAGVNMLEFVLIRTALLVAMVGTAPVVAADFRGTEFGGACAPIPDREIALGSTLNQRQQSNADSHNVEVLKFGVQAFGRDVVAVYLCSDGVLDSGGYQFQSTTYDEAFNEFVAVYGELTAKFGPPAQQAANGAALSQSIDLSTLEMPEPITYSASWQVADFYPDLSLMSGGDGEGSDWHVVYSFMRAN